MKYYIIAGEASGDLHGSNLIYALKKEDTQADCRVWGGDLMEKSGAKLVKHYQDLAFMGFLEVLKNLKTILGNLAFCKKDIIAYQPDVLILIDYPGFNLRIAKWAKQQNIRVFYYISPQIWAWHRSRVHQIKRNVERMFVILPFEKSFYQQYQYEVDFVGHPLLDAIENTRADKHFLEKNQLSEKPIIALLPGSRRQEINLLLPEMLLVAKQFVDYQFVIAAAPSQPKALYEAFLTEQNGEKNRKNVAIVFNETYSLLQNAHAALVTSGTATLETALLNVPQIVCYKGSSISYHIAKQLVDLKYISLVNLIADKKVVAELIQNDCTSQKIAQSLAGLLETTQYNSVLEDYTTLRTQLGNIGASERAAKLMYGYLKEA